MDCHAQMREKAELARWFTARAFRVLLPALVFFASAIALYFLCSSCTTQTPQATDVQALVAKWNEISADGVITPAEAAEFAAMLADKLQSKTTIDWATIGTVAAGMAGTFFGVNVYRNGTRAAALRTITSDPGDGTGGAGSGTTQAKTQAAV